MLLKQELDSTPTEFFPDFVPLEEILFDNKTVISKNYTISQCVRLCGIDYQGLSSDAIEELHNIRKAFFSDEELADKVKVSFHSRRRKVQFSDRFFACSNKLASEVAHSYLQHFTGGYITELTIVVTMYFGNLSGGITRIPSSNFQYESKKLCEIVAKLDIYVGRITSRLACFDPQILLHKKLLEFWMYVINCGQFGVIPLQTKELGNNLTLADIEFFPQQKYVQITSTHGHKKYCAFLSLKAYPAETSATLIDSLMALELEINLVQWFAPQDKEKTKQQIDKLIKKLRGGLIFAGGRIVDLLDAANRIDGENLNFHHHTLVISVLADTSQELSKNIHQIEAVLAPNGVALLQEGWNMQACFFSQFPGNEHFLKARSRLVSPDNLAHFITFSGAHEGHTHSAFGDQPIAPFWRKDGSLYNFIWQPVSHLDASGHSFICGSPGTGKTTLIMFLIMMSMGQGGTTPLRTLIFDSGRGTKIPSLAFGGTYQTIGTDNSSHLNPMSLPDSNENRTFLQRFIISLAGGDVTEKERSLVAEIVRQNYQLPADCRRLNELRDIFGLQIYGEGGKSSLAAKLAKWLPDNATDDISKHQNGMLFNAHTDSLAFGGQIAGFDMSLALKDSQLLAPLASYIFHRFNNYITENPTPHLVFIDEARQYLENKIFGQEILRLLREQRKKNGAIILAAQEPTMLTESENGLAALQNIETFIIFPNASASRKDYMTGLGLNDREYEFIKTPSAARLALVKRKNGASAIINVDLSMLGQHLPLFHSSAKTVRWVEELIQTNPAGWAEEFLIGDK